MLIHHLPVCQWREHKLLHRVQVDFVCIVCNVRFTAVAMRSVFVYRSCMQASGDSSEDDAGGDVCGQAQLFTW